MTLQGAYLRPRLPELALVAIALISVLRILGLGGEFIAGLATWLPIDPSTMDPIAAMTAAAGLAAVALALGRRKRLAWPLAFVYFIFAAVSEALVLRRPLGAALALICLTILIWDARRYQSATDRRMRVVAITVTVGGLLALVIGSILVSVTSVAPQGSVLDSLSLWLTTALGVSDPTTLALPTALGTTLESIESVIPLMILIAALAILAADPDRPAAAKIERDRATAALHVRGALAPFQLGRDKLLYSAREDGGVIAYGRAGRTVVVLGDPIGPSESAWRTFGAFVERCRVGDVNLSVYQVNEASRAALQSLGYRTFLVGEEAVINLAQFDLSKPRTANLRHAVSRARRGGVEVVWYPLGLDAEGSAEWAAELRDVDHEWQADRGPKMGFTLSPFDVTDLTAVGLAIASNAEGRVDAFVSYRRIGTDSWVLDNTRRRTNATPGALESCIAIPADAMREAGDAELSLGLVALAGLSWNVGPMEERILAISRACVRPAYNISGLLFFKAKFDPEWRPRYGAVRDRIGIVGYLLALVRLHLAVRIAAPPR